MNTLALFPSALVSDSKERDGSHSPPRDLPRPGPPPGPLPQRSAGPPATFRSMSATPGLNLPPMLRASSQSAQRSVNNGGVGPEWRSHVTIEERTAVRKKLREAYKKNCPSYEKLLEMAVAVDEEMVFAQAITKMDYFKAGIEWENRLTIKRQQLDGKLGINGLDDKKKNKNKRSAADANLGGSGGSGNSGSSGNGSASAATNASNNSGSAATSSTAAAGASGDKARSKDSKDSGNSGAKDKEAHSSSGNTGTGESASKKQKTSANS